MLLILLYAVQVLSYLSQWIKSLSVITYKNCEMLLRTAFDHAALIRNNSLIYNQLSRCGRDPIDTDTLILRTAARNTYV